LPFALLAPPVLIGLVLALFRPTYDTLDDVFLNMIVKASMKTNVAEFDLALGKIAGATPTVSELTTPIKTFKTWVEARTLIETATPAKGSVAKLPAGSDVKMIFDPALPIGTAIVLSDEAMLVGHEGHSNLTITTGNAAESLGMPLVTGTPVAAAEGEEVLDGVLIINPADSRGTINYNINGNHYVAQPGMKQKLAPATNGRQWKIDYDRGENFGQASYELAPGTYNFMPTETGWQLYKQRYDIVLDNAKSNQEFNVIFQGEDLAVPSGGAKTLTSKYPVVVRFDRGNGEEFVAKAAPITTGTLQVGINADDNLWDLFPTSDNKREPNLKPFNVDGQRNPK